MTRPSKLEPPIEHSLWSRELIDWFDRNQRDLPWRRAPDPYRVWLSEIMLQQTQVKTMLPYFERFISAYPSVADLADADETEVLDLWAGLGYYRRARNLHRTAQIVARDFDGKFPDRLEDLMQLPGIGRYSASAILSIARGQPYPVLDGNVRRVLSRYLAVEGALSDGPFWAFLEEAVAVPAVAVRISDFNQGLMELGAIVCTPRNPICPDCPIRDSCVARRKGLESELPAARTRRKPIEETHTVVVITRRGRYLMHCNDRGPFLKGLWEFPRLVGRFESNRALARGLMEEFGLCARVEGPITRIRHQITFRKLTFIAVGAVLHEDPPDPRWEWVAPQERGRPMSAYVRKVLAAG